MHKYSADELEQSAVCLMPGTDLIYTASCTREVTWLISNRWGTTWKRYLNL